MKLLQAATPEGRKTAIIMLLLTGAYLVFELGFNARLLDVVGGEATPDEVDRIETYGRIISGVALTLLIWGGQIKKSILKKTNLAVLLFQLGVSACICIFLMYHGQKILIDTLADRSSADTRARSAVLVPISHLIKTDNFHLAQMDVARSAYETPEGKTFIATFALQALAVPKLFKTVRDHADDVFRLSVTSARGTAEKGYADFQKSVTTLKARYHDDYEPGVRKYDAEIHRIGEQQRSAWRDYKNSLVYRGMFGRVRLIEPSRVPRRKWDEVRKSVQAKGIEVGKDWRPDDMASFNQAIDSKVRREAKLIFERESKAALKSDVALSPGLTFSQWLDSAPIQKQWHESLKLPVGSRLSPGMSLDDYESRIYEPTIQADVRRLKKERLAPDENYDDAGLYEAIGKDSARALMVPPIALTFSLLGAFTHILKCVMFIAKIFLTIPKALFFCIMVLYLGAVITVPFSFPNEITRQRLVATLAMHTTAALSPFKAAVLNNGSHWVMLMQKYFYPVNERVRTSVLQGFTYGYQDAGSSQVLAPSPIKSTKRSEKRLTTKTTGQSNGGMLSSLLEWPMKILNDFREKNLHKN